ncbi:DUF1302 domain-containing protein [Solimonas sp. K1W22B-7]|uniref:DUF1302 domain-containing protein n=1 Tax=Solimonas sp. K1W22B-7 TaxID=2303331 RepID=UPI000E3320B2|nr:DUF1302 domain-containing protein [Solimonas sp. K1W22B-7]AXQ27916.1 DUF1302 domain-containing protein [Solimonas sp. K1W22B-7]
MKNINKKNLISLAAAALFVPALPAQAFSDEVHGVSLQLESKLSVGVAKRVQSRDDGLVGIANGGTAYSTNGDDGNLAFDKGDLVAAAAKVTSDLTFTRGNWGAFFRGSYVFNEKLRNYDFFNRADYGPGKEAPLSEYDAKNEILRDRLGSDADLLDAYLFGAFDIGPRSMAFKLGRQVINWGESTFVLHGINSILAFDQAQLRVPGFELDEVLVPTENLWLSYNLLENLSMEAFYQLNWRRTDIDPSGSYWGTNDFAGIGGNRANLGLGRVDENAPAGTICTPPGVSCVFIGSTVPRGRDKLASDSGQGGIKLSTLVKYLNDMDLSVYAMNYHSRLPLFSGTSRASAVAPASTANYFVEYPEDIQLYGVSFNTTVGDYSVQGEYSYKVDQPLQIDDIELLLTGLGAPSQINPNQGAALGGQYIRGWRRYDISQGDLGFTALFPPNRLFGWDQVLMVGEAGMAYVHGMPDPEVLAFEAPATYTANPGTAAINGPNPAIVGTPSTPYDRYATPFSWGYKLIARFTYNNVFNMFTVEPTIRFDHDVDGTTPTPITNFVEDRKSVHVSVGVVYLQAWQGEVGYTTYFGATKSNGLGDRNLLGDRDYVEAVLKYSF